MSAARAWSSALQMAFGSLAEVAITSTPCWVRVLMKLTCEEALPSVGPTWLYSPLNAWTAFSPPPSATSKYGLFSCLGRKATFRPEGISASGFASAVDVAAPPLAAVVSTKAATATPVRPPRSRRPVRKLDMGSLSLGPASGAGVWGVEVGGQAGAGRPRERPARSRADTWG